ncbi:hypothetical protein BCA33_18980 [Marinobacter sp. AC-23]|nr:hypothetical protein BCA33_18980 [Marinobacter sp. AC-23]
MVFLFQPLPEAIQILAYSLIIQICKTLAPKHDDIHSGQLKLMPKGFSHLTFNPVSLNRQFQVLFRKNKTDPGVSEVIRSSQNQKISVRNLQLYVVEDFAIITRS